MLNSIEKYRIILIIDLFGIDTFHNRIHMKISSNLFEIKQ